jgi:hypothetical protein
MECPSLNLIKIWELEKSKEKINNYVNKPVKNENINKNFDISIINIIKDYETNITKL